MKQILIVLFLTVSVCGFARQVGDYDTKHYPQISFVWHEYNPEQRTKADFVLKDNEIINVEVCTPHDSVNKLPKTILFLWEDMASHDKQFEFAKQILTSFLNSQTNKDDKFNVAVFNRKDKESGKILRLLSDHFVSDKQNLINRINSYRPSKETFSSYPTSTDLYEAIGEGLDYLGKEAESIKAVVVITGGLNINASGAVYTQDKPRSISLDNRTPVYVVQYPRYAKGGSGIISLAKDTYGESVATMNAKQAANSVADWYKNMNSRIYGVDYKVTFKTDQKRDGEAHNMTLVVNGADKHLSALVLTANFGDWIKEHLLLFIGLIVFLLALIVGIFLFVRKKMKERQEKQAKKEREQDEQIQQAQRENERIETENRHIQEGITAQEALEAARKEEERRNNLIRRMRLRNLYPRLIGSMNGKNINFTITKLETTIGWEGDNDLVLPFDTVSGHHAKIVFNGEDFEIFDCNSLNHVIVNGFIVTQKLLKNTDMIGLGEVILTIYI